MSKLQAHSCASQHVYVDAHKINVFYHFFPFITTENHPETIPELAKENQQHSEYNKKDQVTDDVTPGYFKLRVIKKKKKVTMGHRRQTRRMPSGSLHYTPRIFLYKHRRRRRQAVPHYKGSPSSHKWNFSTGLIYDVPICSTVTKCKSKRRFLHLQCVLCKYVYGSSSAAGCVSLQEQCDCFREDELF